MNRKRSGKSVISKLFIVIIFLVGKTLAARFYDCMKVEKNDNRIRIGFLSRYKSSKVSCVISWHGVH